MLVHTYIPKVKNENKNEKLTRGKISHIIKYLNNDLKFSNQKISKVVHNIEHQARHQCHIVKLTILLTFLETFYAQAYWSILAKLFT